MDDLKPCPFCGSSARYILKDDISFGKWWDVGCNNQNCFLNEGADWYHTKDNVTELWNTRTTTPWTTEPPSEEGWYWYSNAALEYPTVIRIEQHESLGLGTAIFDGALGFISVREMAMEDGAKLKGPLRPEG